MSYQAGKSSAREMIMWGLIWLLLLLAVLCSGCNTMYKYPVTIECKGKGVITGSGHANFSVAVGGTEINTFNIQADCGDGFVYKVTPTQAVKP